MLQSRDLEQLVANLFENTGYELVGSNHYDGNGGDADIIATTKVPLISDYIETDLKVYIQVKQKDGQDWDDVHGIKQLQKISEFESNVMKVLASTVDEFSDKAKSLAAEYNVILINGHNLVELMSRHL